MSSIYERAQRNYESFLPLIDYLEQEIIMVSSRQLSQNIKLPSRLLSKEYETLTLAYRELK
jgi:hypothetical protein